jgi:DNA-binding MarR family transcriptional regulator
LDQEEFLQQFSTVEQLVLRVGWLEQRSFAQDLAGFGLTPPQFFVLRSIALHGEHPTMTALADDTLQHCATLTGVVDRLVRMGLVTRRRDDHDRRQVLVELTSAGREALAKVRQGREGRLRQTLSHMLPQEAAELLRLLQVYLEAFRMQYKSAEAASRGLPGGVHGYTTR